MKVGKILHICPGSALYGIFQARILAWVTISFSRGSSHPGMDFMAPVSSAIAGSLLHGATWEALHLLCINNKKGIFEN